MTEEKNYCLEHSGLTARLNLLISLMIGSCSGIAALFIVCINIYFSINEHLAALDKQVALNSKMISHVEAFQQDLRLRLHKLEE